MNRKWILKIELKKLNKSKINIENKINWYKMKQFDKIWM